MAKGALIWLLGQIMWGVSFELPGKRRVFKKEDRRAYYRQATMLVEAGLLVRLTNGEYQAKI